MNVQTGISQYTGSDQPPLVPDTIGDIFDRTVAANPEGEGLVVRHQGIRWTYLQYQREVERLAGGLLSIGITKGDRVGIWAPNCYEWCLTQYATAKIGAILVCINPAYRKAELEYALNKVECSALVTAERFKQSNYHTMLHSLVPELSSCAPGELQSERFPHLKSVISTAQEPPAGMYRFSEICERGEAELSRLPGIAADLDAHDAINIQFTSGTTGNPKGATLSHHNILNNALMCAQNMKFTHEDRLCIPVPLYHCFGMVLGTLVCVGTGATAIFPGDAFEPDETLRAVHEERCTALHGVPTMFIAELDSPAFGNFDLRSLRTGIMAGSPCPVEVMNKVRDKMHMGEILIGYGQTECSPINHMTLTDDPVEKRVNSVGKPVPHCEIKIVDADGEVVALGDKGEICARGYNVMRGYWNDEQRTTETIDTDGWLHSGDIGVMDEEGYVQVTGRIKDMIIRGGENIYPREIEEFLYGHPDILEVQVFGVPNERLGEEVCAWIQPRDNADLDEQAVLDFCRDKIAHFKVPRHIHFVDQYPMTVTGKMQKFVMREQMTELLSQENKKA